MPEVSRCLSLVEEQSEALGNDDPRLFLLVYGFHSAAHSFGVAGPLQRLSTVADPMTAVCGNTSVPRSPAPLFANSGGHEQLRYVTSHLPGRLQNH